MKIIMIVYNSAVNDEVMEILEACKVKGYTKWEKVYGKGTISGTHLGSDIWPGENSALFIALPEENAEILFAELKKLRIKLGSLGLKAFSWELAEIT